MKTICLLLSCYLFILSSAYAQEFPSFGIVSQQELTLKQVDFDKDANAVVLLHEAHSDYDEQHKLITNHHIRIKILKEKGISEADVTIPFYRKDDFENITSVEGLTINPQPGGGANIVKLEKKSIFTKAITDRIGEVIFTFPNIKVGSIIDYRYRSIMKHYGGLEDWYFQQELPVLQSKYTLMIVPNTEFAYRVNKMQELPITVNKLEGGVFFEMTNIGGLGNEPYMDARRDYLQKVVFQLSSYGMGGNNKKNYMTSWEEVTRELTMSADFGGQLKKSIQGTEAWIKEIKLLPLPEERMKRVYHQVQQNTTWNGLYSKYVIEGVRDAWQKKPGSSGDINLLLVNLLNEAGLEAYPMLVSERFHGKVNPAYPFIDQFNSVFACVVIGNKKYYLDATSKTCPPHLVPHTILNTTAFVVNRKRGGLVNITNDTLQYREQVLVQLTLDDQGRLAGSVSVNSADYARMDKLKAFKADKEKYLRSHFIVDGTTISGKEPELRNIDNDSLALEQQCKVSGTLNTSGGYHFLPLNLFTGFDFNPFVGDNRFSNINFGYRRSVVVNVFIDLPHGYTIDALPKSVKLTNPEKDIVYVRQVEYDSTAHSLRCLMQFQFSNSLYDAGDYPVMKEMYKKIFDYLKEPVVLKRNG